MPKLSSKLVSALVLARGDETQKSLHELVNTAEAGGEDAVQAKVVLQFLRSFNAIKDHGPASGRAFKATPANLTVELLEADGFVRGAEKDVMGQHMLVMTRAGEEIFVPMFVPKVKEASNTAAA
jgi:hypothetical protein